LQLFHHLRQPLITIHHILNLVGRLDRVGLEFEVIHLFPYPKGALSDAVFLGYKGVDRGRRTLEANVTVDENISVVSVI
jgi:hypothetical protein